MKTVTFNLIKPEKQGSAEWLRLVHLLLQAISLHSVEGEGEAFRNFRSQVESLAERFSEEASQQSMLMAIGYLSRTMEEYNRATSVFLKRQSREFQSMLSMTTQTISFLGSSSTTAVEQLQSIEKKIERASDMDNIRELRANLEECLVLVRSESVRLRQESESQRELMQKAVEATARSGSGTVEDMTIDPATGLRTRLAAEQTIARIIASGPDSTFALFLIDRLPAINLRYGRAVGDGALLMVAQQLARHLPEGGALFRWTGPSFVVIVPNADGSLEGRMRKIASAKLEESIETQDKSVLLTFTRSLMLHRSTARDSAEELFQKMDRFVTGQVSTRDKRFEQ